MLVDEHWNRRACVDCDVWEVGLELGGTFHGTGRHRPLVGDGTGAVADEDAMCRRRVVPRLISFGVHEFTNW